MLHIQETGTKAWNFSNMHNRILIKTNNVQLLINIVAAYFT